MTKAQAEHLFELARDGLQKARAELSKAENGTWPADATMMTILRHAHRAAWSTFSNARAALEKIEKAEAAGSAP